MARIDSVSVVHLSIKTLFKFCLLVVLVPAAAYILVSLSPIDPVNAYMGVERLQFSAELREHIAKRWGLEEPKYLRLFYWAKNCIQGDFGNSLIYNQPVVTVIKERSLRSFWLFLSAWITSAVLGFLLGICSGVWENSLMDKAIRYYAYALSSAPTFWIALLLITLFSVQLQWTPLGGATPIGIISHHATFWQRLYHMILPVITLSITGVAAIAMHTREKVIDIMNSDFVLFARAQGETPCTIAYVHVFRNALLPAITLLCANIGELFGGVVLIEQVFSYPGLGRATVEAGIRQDVPLLLAIVLITTILVAVGNGIADVLYTLIDPRIRNNQLNDT